MNDASKPRSVSSHSSSAAPINNVARRLPGYTFNNGNAKQPILRARECDTGCSDSSGVDLNFNYWMEHSYVVDRQLSSVVSSELRNADANPTSDAPETEAILKAQSLDAVNNILVVSVQGVDPRELNDCILDLPFLRSTSSMPVRHIREAAPALVPLEDTAGGQAASEQQWQYLDVDCQNALMLWCEKPSVPLQEVAGRSLPDLLAHYTLTFQGVHTLWQDDVVMFTDQPSGNTSTSNGAPPVQNPATVLAYQDLARQKLLYNKDAPAYMLQLFCDLTKPPLPGDLFGRCTRAKAKETGMFLYRPGTSDTAVATARLMVLWQRTKEIDILEAQIDPVQQSLVSPLTFVKLNAAKIAGRAKARFQEQSELSLKLSKAVLRDRPVAASTAPTAGNDESVDTSLPAMAVGVPRVSAGTSTMEVVSTVLEAGRVDCVAADSVGSSATTTDVTLEVVNAVTAHAYFSPALQQQMTDQICRPEVRSALQDLVLSHPMQEIMGFVTARTSGYEDFLHTGHRFYKPASRPPPPPSLAFVAERTPSAGSVSAKKEDELEEGEEPESDEDVQENVHTPEPATLGNGVNSKKYFEDYAAESGAEDDSSSGDDDAFARTVEENLRKRKAQIAELVQVELDAEDGEVSDDSASPPEVAPSNKRPKVEDVQTSAPVMRSTQKGLTIPPLPVRPPFPPPPPLTRPPPPSAPRPVSALSDFAVGNTAVTEMVADSAMAVDAGISSSTSPAAVYLPTLISPYSIPTPLEVCALDCEMCTTAAGLELTRLTVLSPVHGVVYDTLVQPELEVLDFHTEFSGITKEALAPVTVTLQDVQTTLRAFISERTIIVGHSADTDLKVLKLIHDRVVDTAALFPHPSGLPYKHALKKLAKEYLRKDIQDGKEGHDSVQDAAVALELALLKASAPSEVARVLPWGDDPVPKYSVFEALLAQEVSAPTSDGLRISVHGVPSLLGADVSDWEKFAFGYRPESDSCTALQHCRASLELRLAALRDEVSSIQQQTGSGDRGDEVAGKIRHLENMLQQVRGKKHGSSEEAVAAGLTSLEQLSAARTAGDVDASHHQRSLVLVEVHCEHSGGGDCGDGGDRASSNRDRDDPDHCGNGSDRDAADGWEGQCRDSQEDRGSYGDDAHAAEWGTRRSGEGPARPLMGHSRVDDQVRRLYEAAAPGTLMLVVTQGSMVAMKLLASQKMRNRWEQAAVKRKQSLVGTGRVTWDATIDEGRLIAAAAHAAAGAVFVAKKR